MYCLVQPCACCTCACRCSEPWQHLPWHVTSINLQCGPPCHSLGLALQCHYMPCHYRSSVPLQAMSLQVFSATTGHTICTAFCSVRNALWICSTAGLPRCIWLRARSAGSDHSSSDQQAAITQAAISRQRSAGSDQAAISRHVACRQRWAGSDQAAISRHVA